MKTDLKLDWASVEAAKYACEKWHYSGNIPKSKLVRIGVWEECRFIGVVLFGSGASANLADSFDVRSTEVCELIRIALTAHQTPVSRIVAIALRMLRKQSPLLRLCVSFADPAQGHHGGIYQAGNWIFTGQSRSQIECFYNQKWVHVRTIYHRISDSKFERLPKRRVPGKFRYIMPFDEIMRKQILKQKEPYPKKCAGSIDVDASGFHSEEHGSSPMSALQNNSVLQKNRKNILT